MIFGRPPLAPFARDEAALRSAKIVSNGTELDTNAANSTQSSKPWLEPYRFQKGISGNPSGRPKRKPITEAYEELLTPIEARKLAQAMLRQAKRGNVKAAAEVTDRVEGKLAYDDSDRTPAGIQVLVINEIVRPDAIEGTYGVLAQPVDNVLNINGMQEAPGKQQGQSETKAK